MFIVTFYEFNASLLTPKPLNGSVYNTWTMSLYGLTAYDF